MAQSNVHQLKHAAPTPFDGGGGGDDNGGMEARISTLEAILPTLATKADITELRLATKADVAEIRTDLHETAGETHKWMIATVIGLFIGFGGLFLAMSNALKPASPVAAQAPVIINVPPATPPAAAGKK